MNKIDHTLVHFEIPANDVEKLNRFLRGTFWFANNNGLRDNRVMVNPNRSVDKEGKPVRPGVNGGMNRKQSPESKPVNCYAVESIHDSLAKTEKIGGKTTQTVQEVPNVGWIAAAKDPEGN